MLKDIFPVKFIIRPSAAFAEIAEGKAGWAWPLAVYAASIISSALLLSAVPAEFMARASSDLPTPGGLSLAACVLHDELQPSVPILSRCPDTAASWISSWISSAQ